MNDIPAVVTYVPFDIDQIPPEINKSEELKDYVLLNTQGENVELMQSSKTSLLMFVFDILHEVCPEVVLRTDSQDRFVIFDHIPDKTIHPVGVSTVFSMKTEFHARTEPVAEVVLNLGELWDITSIENEEAKILEILAKLKNQIKTTKTTTLIGEVPVVLLLLAQHLVGYNTRQLFYKNTVDSIPKRIK